MLRRLIVLSLLLCVGCSAQSNPNTQSGSLDVNQRIERQVHAYFGIPADVSVKIGARTPSEFPNYDNVPVTLSRQDKSQTMEFLVSKDGKTLIRMTKIDLTEDPYAATMKKIDVAGRPIRGNPDAKVTIVNYDDFECPFCARMHSTLMTEILPAVRRQSQNHLQRLSAVHAPLGQARRQQRQLPRQGEWAGLLGIRGLRACQPARHQRISEGRAKLVQ